MFNIKFSFKSVYKILQKYYRLIMAVLIILIFSYGALIFYQYIYLVERAEPSLLNQQKLIDEKKLQQIIDNIENREKGLKRVSSKSFPEIFVSEQAGLPGGIELSNQ